MIVTKASPHVSQLHPLIGEFAENLFYERVRHHYDAFTLPYRMFWGKHLHHGLFLNGNESATRAQLLMVQHCLSLLPSLKDSRILDLGCGFGATSILLAEKCPCHVTGITISPRQARYACRSAAGRGLGGRTSFLVANAEDFTYPQAHFDLVWTMEVVEHLRDRKRFFRNMWETLKSGGFLLLTVWTAASQQSDLKDVAELSCCASFQTAAEYIQQLIVCEQDLSSKVLKTWRVAEKRAQALLLAKYFLPKKWRELANMIKVLSSAFTSGELAYHVFVGQKPK
jgi:tocopherol O-methyltransferase